MRTIDQILTRLKPSMPYLAIFTLFSLAIAEPTYSVLTQAEGLPFFIAHRATGWDVLWLVFLYSLMMPLSLCLILLIMARFAPRAAVFLRNLFNFLLLLLLCMPLCSHEPFWALMLSVLFMIAIIRSDFIVRCLAVLSPMVLIFAGLFLSKAQVSLNNTDSRAEKDLAQGSGLPHVVLLVFDQIPMTSLLDINGKIDDKRFKNFAWLSKRSTFYPSAFTLYTHTREAIPSILTGSNITEYRKQLGTRGNRIKNRTPDQNQYPKNLLSFLSDTHVINAFESVTDLWPNHQNHLHGRHHAQRLYGLLSDTTAITLNVVVGQGGILPIPRIDDRYTGFFQSSFVSGDKRYRFAGERAHQVLDFIDSIKHSDLPHFHFLHVVLPHVPFEYDAKGGFHPYRPSGNNKVKTRLGVNIWGGQQENAKAFMLHLEQLQFVDLLLGLIIDKLKNEGVYDDSLLVVTADHGIDFFWDDGRLDLSIIKAIHRLNLHNVPLLVKAPGQREGSLVDEPVVSTDIAPTIASILGMSLPFYHDGIALEKGGNGKAAAKIMQEILSVSSTNALQKQIVLQKIASDSQYVQAMRLR